MHCYELSSGPDAGGVWDSGGNEPGLATRCAQVPPTPRIVLIPERPRRFRRHPPQVVLAPCGSRLTMQLTGGPVGYGPIKATVGPYLYRNVEGTYAMGMFESAVDYLRGE